MIEKTYQPGEVESRIYKAWEDAGAFRAGRPERAKAAPYCIVIPPPNVTGSLHMGHALNNTLQDILCRFERMRGKDVLWQPGTDHAGIATQAVVERQLMERQQHGSREMGREAFIKRVWEWKAESGGTIIGQLKRLGASCDWLRERFTMDEGLSRAVLKVFVALYREGLIYKDKRLVNWDPKLKTAISDLEVVQVETKGNLWHIKYPIEGSDEFITVATTRPETMLGDVAVAVHPENEKLKHLIGKNAILPLVGRHIPIVGDDYADPEKGSGAVKITPAHDFNDFEVGKRHGLSSINIFNDEAKLDLRELVPTRATSRAVQVFGGAPEWIARPLFWTLRAVGLRRLVDRILEERELQETLTMNGMDRFVARKKIVERLDTKNLVEKIEPNNHVVPHGDRSSAVIEPYLTDQWYVDAKTLAAPAIVAVRQGKTKFLPEQWDATFFNWMENIQPWCISRQIWWGHQIPCWYGFKRDGNGLLLIGSSNQEKRITEGFVGETEAEALEQAQEYYQSEVKVVSSETDALNFIGEQMGRSNPINAIWRDGDVLDTWFSSALWPFSTLGWPDETSELKRFYPTTTLVTGFDIIFFWVARMLMMGLHFMNEVPFHDVYIHRLVRDASGAKMSKSKGNVVDPLGVIDQYGADALRFTLARGAAQGHDIRLGPQEVENNRNFATKLWNAARFAEMNDCRRAATFNPHHVNETINKWIVDEVSRAIAEVTRGIEEYRFNEAAGDLYRFVWNVFCDWYLELAKPILLGTDESAKRETQLTLAWTLDQILKLLHPFMPFITEELWTQTAYDVPRSTVLAVAEWPNSAAGSPDASTEIGWVIDLIAAIRSVRAEMNITAQIPLVLAGASAETQARAERWAEFIKRLARVSEISFAAAPPPGSLQLVVRGDVAALPLKGVIDLDAERARLAKEMAKADADIARVDAKLGNPNFVSRAPEEVVEEEKEKREEAQARKAKIAEALERLKGSA